MHCVIFIFPCSRYDLLLSALGKLDMMYLLDEVGGFTFDDSPIKTENDTQTEDQNTGVEDTLNDIGKVQSTNEIPTPDSTCIKPDIDDVCSLTESVNLPPLGKCPVNEEPEDLRSEPVVWTVQEPTCYPHLEMDILTNEDSDNCRKRLVSASDNSDNIDKLLLQDLKKELESDSETVENDLDMNEVERAYQNVKESLNYYSVLSEVPTPTDSQQSSELGTMDKSPSGISSTSCDPCNSIASALLESSYKSSNTSSQAETVGVPISVISTTESDVDTCTNTAAEVPQLSTDNLSVESMTSELSIHSVNTLNSGSFGVSKSHSGTEIITDRVLKSESLFIPCEEIVVPSEGNVTFCENVTTSIPASLTGLLITNSKDCHNTQSPALFSNSITSSSCENQPCTVFSLGSMKSFDSSVKTSIMCTTVSTTDNKHQILSLPVDVWTTRKEAVGSKCVTQVTVTPVATICSDLICGNTSKLLINDQYKSVSNDKSEEILSKTVQVSEVNIATKPVVADKTDDVHNEQCEQTVAVDQLAVKSNIKQVVTGEMNEVLKPIGPLEQFGDDVNCVSGDVTLLDHCTHDLNEEANQSKDHSVSEVDIESRDKVIKNLTACEHIYQSKLVINEDQVLNDLNNETMQVNQNDIVSDLEGTVNENLSSDELNVTTNQVVTKCINQNLSETHNVTCAAKLTTKVQTSSYTVCQTHFHNHHKSKSKSKSEGAKLSCTKDVLSKTKTDTSIALKRTTNSKLMSNTSVTYSSKLTMCTDFNAVLSNRLKHKLSNEATSGVSHDYSNRKTIEVKPGSAQQKSKRKPLVTKESKKSKLGTKNPVLADILNCRRNENIYSQIQELEFEKIDGTPPSDLAECDVLTENATAFLKMSDQNIDTSSGSQSNRLRNSQTNQQVTSIGDVGSVDNNEQLKEKMKSQFGKSVKRKAVSDRIIDNNSVSEEVQEIICIDDESSEVAVRSPSHRKNFNEKQWNFLKQTESPLKSSSVECIIPVSEVLSLTPAELVANYMSKMEKIRENNNVKDNAPQTTDNNKSVVGKSGTLKGTERVQINAERGKSDHATNNQTTDKTPMELNDNSNSDVGVQSSEVLSKDFKSIDQINCSKTTASNPDTLKNVPTITVHPIQKVTNQTNPIRQQCTILPKVPVTMVRFPLRILSHSIQTGKHVIQVEHPTVTSTSISPRCSNTLVPNSDGKFARKRWKSTPDNNLLRKRKSVDEPAILENLKVSKNVNPSDIKKRKVKDSNQTEIVHESALDFNNDDRALVVTDNTEGTIKQDLSMASSMKGKLELQNKLEDDGEDASLDNVPSSVLRVKLFDGPSTSNFKQGDANNLTDTNQCKEQSSVTSVSNGNNHLSVINEPEQKAEMEVVFDITDDPDSINRTVDSVEDDFDNTKDKKCQNNGSDGLFTNVTKRKKPSDEAKSTAYNNVIQNKLDLKPPALKSCRTNLSLIRKQTAAQKARASRLNHKMVLVNGKQAAKRRSHTKSKKCYDLVFKSEPSHSNIQTVAIVPSSGLGLEKILVDTTVNPKCAISACSKSTTVLSTMLNSPRPSTNQTPVLASVLNVPIKPVASTAFIAPSSAIEPLTQSSWSTKPLANLSHPAVTGSSSRQVVLLSSLQTLPSVSTKSLSVEAIKKSPTPVLSSMLLSHPLKQTQPQNCDETELEEKKTRKYKKKNTSEKSADDIKKKRVRVSKKNKVDSPVCNPVIKLMDTPPTTVSSNSPCRRILPKQLCVALVMNPTFNQVNE